MTDARKAKAPIDEKRARELLKGERERIEASVAEAERLRKGEIAEVETETDLFQDGQLIEEEEVDDALLRKLRFELAAVGRAEKRLADGTYGFSVEGGEPLPRKRLEAVPWAERTVDEQERYERTHGRPW
ncbi:MAG: hypothetical protein M3O25_11745 [Actinomycetota bacterium]|nr:hypothetical protein [Actinomycetota bacterium]